MNIKQTIKLFVLGVIGSLGLLSTMTPPVYALECGGATTSIISCDAEEDTTDPQSSAIWAVLLIAVNILTALVGVAALGGLIYGAILYTSAGSSPDKVKKARSVFTNVVVGIVAYAFMYAFLNFLIPGGIF